MKYFVRFAVFLVLFSLVGVLGGLVMPDWTAAGFAAVEVTRMPSPTPPNLSSLANNTAFLPLIIVSNLPAYPTATPTPTQTPTPTTTFTPTPTATIGFPEVGEAIYQQNGDVSTVIIPASTCTRVSSSPILVGDFIVWGMYDTLNNCAPHSPYFLSVLGYHLQTGRVYELAQSGGSEATLLHQPDAGLVFQNVVFGNSAALALNANTFQIVYSVPQGFNVTSDASGVYLNGLYYFGTINPPGGMCQNPINPNCGSIFALDANGNLVHSLNLDDGFRSWIGAGLTTDGQFIYAGGAEQFLGDSESQFLYGCSVVKLDTQLNILAYFDPGDEGCHSSGVGQNDEDAVAGEVVIAGDGSLWAVFTHGVDSRNKFAMYHLDTNLQPLCVFELQGGPLPMAGYYQAPTIDANGNVYVNVSLNGVGQNSTGELWKVTPDCQGTKLATLPQGGSSTPVLADDQYILTISAGALQIRDLNGTIVQTYTLATQAMVISSPMIVDGVIYVVDSSGALTIIRNSGLQGYGTAAWPRYRHDNFGSGVQP